MVFLKGGVSLTKTNGLNTSQIFAMFKNNFFKKAIDMKLVSFIITSFILSFLLFSCASATDIEKDEPIEESKTEQIPLSGELELNGKNFSIKKLNKHDYVPSGEGYREDEYSITDCIRKIQEEDKRPYTSVSSLSYAYFNYVDAQQDGYGGLCQIKLDKGSWGYVNEGLLFFTWKVSGTKIQKGLNLVPGIFRTDNLNIHGIELCLCDEDVISRDFYYKWGLGYPKTWPQKDWLFWHYFKGSIRIVNLTDDSITLKFDNLSVGWPEHTDDYYENGIIVPITTPAVICLTINGEVTIPCVHY